MNENMKKIVNVATPAVCVVALVLSVAAISNTTAATTMIQIPDFPFIIITFAHAKVLLFFYIYKS